jgi:hypothetical protein
MKRESNYFVERGCEMFFREDYKNETKKLTDRTIPRRRAKIDREVGRINAETIRQAMRAGSASEAVREAMQEGAG